MLKLWLEFDLRQQCPQEFRPVFSNATKNVEKEKERENKLKK